MVQIKIGMDVAASEFYTKDGKYDLNFKKQPNDGAHVHSAQSLGQLYKDFVKEFPIVSMASMSKTSPSLLSWTLGANPPSSPTLHASCPYFALIIPFNTW